MLAALNATTLCWALTPIRNRHVHCPVYALIGGWLGGSGVLGLLLACVGDPGPVARKHEHVCRGLPFKVNPMVPWHGPLIRNPYEPIVALLQTNFQNGGPWFRAPAPEHPSICAK